MTEGFPRFRTGRPVDPATVIEDLGDGLVLRHAVPDDRDALAGFNSVIHSDSGPGEPDAYCLEWTRKLFDAPHPTLTLKDILIVEDTADGTIASSMLLLPQTWAYAGIPFGVGRPELVGTHPDYRRRGLIRKQFEVVHRVCDERGYLMQGITGIPYYYRQFGYEMCVDLDGHRPILLSSVADLKAGETEPFIVREATATDLPAIMALDAAVPTRSLITCERDEAVWRYEFTRRDDPEDISKLTYVVERAAPGATESAPSGGAQPGEIVSFFRIARPINKGAVEVEQWEVAAGTPWPAVGGPVLRFLKRYACQTVAAKRAEARGKGEDATKIQDADRIELFFDNDDHPAYAGLPGVLETGRPPYAWFIRIPNVAAFLWHIRAALEARLRASPFAGYDGELLVGNYGGEQGVKLVFANGTITASEPWDGEWNKASASYPGHTFLHLITGYRTAAELRQVYADALGRTAEARQLLNALFPRRSSNILAVW